VVDAPEQIEYKIDFTYYISSKNMGLINEIQDKVNSAVDEYVAWQKGALKRDINPTELSYLVRLAGSKRLGITEPCFATVGKFEVAKETTVNVVYGGIEDD